MQKKKAKKVTKKAVKKVKPAVKRAKSKIRKATTKPREINTGTIAVSAEVIPPSKLEHEEFVTEDHIIGNISLPPTTKIRIELTPRSVSLYVGPRDWQWERETGNLIGAGTEIEALETDETTETTKEVTNEEAVESSSAKEN